MATIALTLPTVSWTTLNEALHTLGSGSRRGGGHLGYHFLSELGLVSLTVHDLPPRPPLPVKANLVHRLWAGFVESAEESNRYEWALTQAGRDVYQALFVYCDQSAARELLGRAALRNPVISLVVRVFHGHGTVKVTQVRELFRFQRFFADEAGVKTFLELCDALGTIKLNKRWHSFAVTVHPDGATPTQSYLVHPKTPYANRRFLVHLLSGLKGTARWADRHFPPEGLDLIVDGITPEHCDGFVILSGRQERLDKCIRLYSAAKLELSNRGVQLKWCVCHDKDRLDAWHDRWITCQRSRY